MTLQPPKPKVTLPTTFIRLHEKILRWQHHHPTPYHHRHLHLVHEHTGEYADKDPDDRKPEHCSKARVNCPMDNFAVGSCSKHKPEMSDFSWQNSIWIPSNADNDSGNDMIWRKTLALLHNRCCDGPWFQQSKCKSAMMTGTHTLSMSESFCNHDYDDDYDHHDDNL